MVRPKELFDNAVPSGNSAAGRRALRLAALTGEAEYERGGGCRRCGWSGTLMARRAAGFGHALCALDLYLGPVREVAIVGEPADPATRALGREVSRPVPARTPCSPRPAPTTPGRSAPSRCWPTGLPSTAGPAAYVCEGFACRLPVTDPAELAAQLA